MSARDFRKKQAHIPIAREGIPYILAAMFATLITAVLGWAMVTLLLLAATLLIGHFFRDPERVSIAGESDIVSPADGRVIAVNSVRSARFTDKPAMKISIFMSVFDVHVNRVPISGAIEGIHYRKGRFMAANLVAGERGKRAELALDQVRFRARTSSLPRWPVLLPAGSSAGLKSETGWFRAERFGMIRFGSRMDVYVPENSEILVSQGRHVYAGETVLCE